MCQFNFIVLKETINSKEIGEIASEFNLNFTEKELNVTGKNNIRTFLTTKENCDCDSVIGKKYSVDNSLPDWEKERKKLERKRFSKRRINLLIEQKKQEYTEKNSDEIKKEIIETKKWLEFLNDERIKKRTKEIGILYHQFSGIIEDEKIRIESEIVIPTNKINVELLKRLQENQLIWTK